jgi:hypothetical protein
MQLTEGIATMDHNMVHTEKGTTEKCMEMILDHKVKERVMGILSAAEKK